MSGKTKTLSQLIDESVLASPPDLLFKIINSLDSELSSHQIGEIVGHDQTISAQVLKLSNSSFFGFKGQVKTLDRAINILGTKTVRNIAVTTLLFSHTNNIRLWNLDIMNFWLHAFLVADISREISQKIGLDGDEAYIAGLLHDIGKLILYAQKQDDAEMFSQPHSDQDIYEYEKSNWDMDSIEVSRILLEKWNIPSDIVTAISEHNDLNGNTTLSKVIFISNEFANIITDENHICSLEYSKFKSLLNMLKTSEKDFNRICVSIPDIVERGKLIMSVMSKKHTKFKKKRLTTKATLVSEDEFSLAKCILTLLGFTVNVIHPDVLELQNGDDEDPENKKPKASIQDKIKVPVKQQHGFSEFLKHLFSRKPKANVVVEKEYETEIKAIDWNPLVIFDKVEPIPINRPNTMILRVSEEVNPDDEASIPMFFSNVNIKVE